MHITNTELGYDTQVGERGFLLSGGQKRKPIMAFLKRFERYF